MEILYAVLIMLAVGAGFGFLLALMGKIFNVERDPKIDDVSKCLAGINCGGCGYAGCDAFAVALVNGDVKVDLCRPTKKADKEEINRILGASDEVLGDTVAVVGCNGGHDAKHKFSYQGYGSCVTSQILAEGSKMCPVGCMALKDCVAACGYNAINVASADGYARVNDHKCTSCGACVGKCPKKLIKRIPKSAKVYVACSNLAAGKKVRSYCPSGCIGCGICVKACKYGAMYLKEGRLARINYDKCTNCGDCVKVCPTKVIKLKTN